MTIYSSQLTSSMGVATHLAYIIEGSILVIFCTALSISIFSNSRLRNQKEYVIIAGSAVLDAFYGSGYVVAGIWRLLIYYTEIYIPLYTPWQCFSTFHVFIFILIIPMSGFMVLATTVDRLFSVTFPMKYIRFSTRYAYALLLLCFVPALPIFIVTAIDTHVNLDKTYVVLKTCTISLSTSPQLFDAIRGVRIVCTLLSVLLYAPICHQTYALIKRLNKQAPGDNRFNKNNQQQKRTTTMTYTIALITLNQLICFTVPDLVLMFELCKEIDTNVFYIMNLNKGIVNMIIFLITQKDLRTGIFGKFIKRKIMESSLSRTAIGRRNTKIDVSITPQLVTSIYVADKRLSISPPSNLAEKRLSILSNTPPTYQF